MPHVGVVMRIKRGNVLERLVTHKRRYRNNPAVTSPRFGHISGQTGRLTGKQEDRHITQYRVCSTRQTD